MYFLTKKNTNKINSILRKAISLPEVILPYPGRIWFCKDIQETLNDVEILDESPKKREYDCYRWKKYLPTINTIM